MNYLKTPPAGVFPTAQSIIRFRPDRLDSPDLQTPRSALHLRLWAGVAQSQIELAASGTDALFRVLQMLASRGRSKCYLSAYTCPEIVTAAVQAGFDIFPIDTSAATTCIDLNDDLHRDDFDCSHGVLVLSNLYGFPDPLPDELIERGLVVIDDACQAALSCRGSVPVGFDPRTFGVWSFGRGKAICAFGGGAYRVPNEHPMVDTREWTPRASDYAVASVAAVAYQALVNPILYNLATALPGTGIGTTSYDRTVHKGDIGEWRRLAAMVKTYELIEQRDIYRRNAEIWRSGTGGSSFGEIPSLIEGVYPIRLPAVMKSVSHRANVLREMSAYGVTSSYPATILELCRDEPRMIVRSCPNAMRLAQTLVTLPTHPGLNSKIFHRAFSRWRMVESEMRG